MKEQVWLPDVKCLLIAVKPSKAKTKYDFQTRNTEGIIDVKEQIWLTNVKYLRLST